MEQKGHMRKITAQKRGKQDVDKDGMVDEILKLARERDWPQDLVETCLEALSSKAEDYRCR